MREGDHQGDSLPSGVQDVVDDEQPALREDHTLVASNVPAHTPCGDIVGLLPGLRSAEREMAGCFGRFVLCVASYPRRIGCLHIRFRGPTGCLFCARLIVCLPSLPPGGPALRLAYRVVDCQCAGDVFQGKWPDASLARCRIRGFSWRPGEYLSQL